MSMFKKAKKYELKLRMALIGISGSGKTFTALKVAQGLGEKIAVIDTENRSASRYAGLYDFDVCEIDHYSPNNYIAAIKQAEEAGYDVLIIDSLSHAWSGVGGVMGMLDKAKKRYGNNSYYAWAEITPIQDNLVNTIIQCKCHVIVTMRAKSEYVESDTGKKKIYTKVGVKAIQRDDLEYEFDLVATMDLDHNMTIEKSRLIDAELDGVIIEHPDESLGELIAKNLNGEVWIPPHWSEDVTKQDRISTQVVKLKASIEKYFEANGVEGWEGFVDTDISGAESIKNLKDFI